MNTERFCQLGRWWLYHSLNQLLPFQLPTLFDLSSSDAMYWFAVYFQHLKVFDEKNIVRSVG